MKEQLDDFSIMTDFDNLYAAHLVCRRGKRWKDSVAIYDVRGFECTWYLQRLVENGSYRLSPYNCFQINERGKKRDIKSIRYRDRVVQKVLMDQILTPTVQPTFIDCNGASQKGKGTDYALKKLREHLQRQVRKRTGGYVLISDMKGYFDSIPHKILNDYYKRRFKDERLIGLIHHIHASIPGGVGVPLGNQLSQLDALLALSPLDHHIKEKLHIEGYGRYMDDFYLIHDNKEYLKECLSCIRKYAEDNGLRLNNKKTRIVPMTQGIDFLGFHFYVTKTGKVVQKLQKKSILHHKKKLRKMKALLDRGECTLKACYEAHNGWRAHAMRGDTHYLIRKMDAFFEELFAQYIQKEKEANKNVTSN